MIKEVDIELFNFDRKTDYLPYYKKYTLEYNKNERVIDLLNKINKIEKFNFEDSDCKIKINNLYLSADELISDVVEKAGSDLTIEPVSIYRADKDLVVDKTDFLHKIDMFDKYLTDEEKEVYAKKYQLEYYASNSLDINRDYIGDHVLLIACDIIEKNPESKEEILNFIADKDDGIWYHTSLKNRVFNFNASQEEKIEKLFGMFKETKDFLVKEVSFDEVVVPEISQYFKGFNIASYVGLENDSVKSTIIKSQANYIDIEDKKKDLAPYSSVADKTFSLKIAGQILLQAKDNNVDFMIVRDADDLVIFDKEQKKIEKIVGREIDMPVISQNQFIKLLKGEKNIHKLGFNAHKVKISFL